MSSKKFARFCFLLFSVIHFRKGKKKKKNLKKNQHLDTGHTRYEDPNNQARSLSNDFISSSRKGEVIFPFFSLLQFLAFVVFAADRNTDVFTAAAVDDRGGNFEECCCCCCLLWLFVCCCCCCGGGGGARPFITASSSSFVDCVVVVVAVLGCDDEAIEDDEEEGTISAESSYTCPIRVRFISRYDCECGFDDMIIGMREEILTPRSRKHCTFRGLLVFFFILLFIIYLLHAKKQLSKLL